eukprot:14901495-Ditylum_brightwellii.AAC.1
MKSLYTHEYRIVALCDDYKPDANLDATDLWAISEGTELYNLIYDWYKKNPDPPLLYWRHKCYFTSQTPIAYTWAYLFDRT